ncbi:CBS domain-containing protein [Streptomyces sp. NPDC087437]|uniref:CBS domain-containing protein n=1 Tax=Streptomyces sp. NPDC087437 TaxID=3365789 RepID=UPI0037F74104
MTSAADLMHPGAHWIPATETLAQAARLMRELNVGALRALPVSAPNDVNGRRCGISTDHDIVIGCIAAGHDPSHVTAGELSKDTPRRISTAAGVGDVLQQMQTHQIRRLPVIDENKRPVGMISEHDLARSLTNDQIAQFMERVYA